MTLLKLNHVSQAYGHLPLLDQVDFQIVAGERVCLVGRNGTGKSTLFRIISGAGHPDDGEIWRKDSLRISHLEQDVETDSFDTVYEVVASGLGELGTLLSDYHELAHKVGNSDAASLDRLSALQHRIEAGNGWNINQKVETVISRLSLPADKPVLECSGGVRRRVMLARALVSDPELLLLDEPSNHMDIAAITWLEEFLSSFQGALMFITHDRTFLKHLATRIIELDRGVLTSFAGGYDHYLKKKEELLARETTANAKFDKKLAEYEAWIRQGIKARRTRNEGKVRKLQAMRRERSQRIGTQGKVNLDVDTGALSGKLVSDLRHVSFHYGDHCIVDDLSTRILRGDRVGIIGPNGSGKSTLLKIILGELAPGTGQVVKGTGLQLAYFDQQRARLDPAKTVRDNLGDGRDFIRVKGRSRHIVSYLKDFLFPPERIDSPVKALSGGERNRLLLARMFAQPANIMVLDEPTNDLDVETLELLEELLADYDGTLLLVSHDRAFLDNVVTSTLAFEGNGKVADYVGGYEDWLRQRSLTSTLDKPLSDRLSADNAEKSKKNTGKAAAQTVQKQRLSYKEKQELAALPERIEALEEEQRLLEQEVSQSQFYQQDKEAITTTLEQLNQIGRDLQIAFDRWEYLDSIEVSTATTKP